MTSLLFVWLLIAVIPSSYCSCQNATTNSYDLLRIFGLRKNLKMDVYVNSEFEYHVVTSVYLNQWEATLDLKSTLPSWLEYNASSMTLFGTPGEGDQGTVSVKLDAVSLLWKDATCNSNFQISLTIDVLDNPFNTTTTTTGSKDLCGDAPVLVNPVDKVEAQVGRPFLYGVCDTFKSVTDPDLILTLTLPYGEVITDEFWIQADREAAVLYGLPLKLDTIDRLSLVAIDKCGQKSKDAIHLDLTPLPTITHTFTLDFIPVANISRNNEKLSAMVSLVASLDMWFKDLKVYLVDTEWYTNRLIVQFLLVDSSHEVCSKPYLRELLEDMEHSSVFGCLFAPKFSLKNISVNFTEKCVDTHVEPVMSSELTMSKYKSTLDHWLEVVVPCAAFLVIVTIVIIVLMACSRKYRHRRKRYVLTSEIPTYLEDRKPIIFPDETRRKDSTLEPRSPVVLSENGENDPAAWHMDDEENGSQPLLTNVSDRYAPSPPEYLHDEIGVPPPYRLPPPYHSPHPTW